MRKRRKYFSNFPPSPLPLSHHSSAPTSYFSYLVSPLFSHIFFSSFLFFILSFCLSFVSLHFLEIFLYSISSSIIIFFYFFSYLPFIFSFFLFTHYCFILFVLKAFSLLHIFICFFLPSSFNHDKQCLPTISEKCSFHTQGSRDNCLNWKSKNPPQ